MKTLRWLLFIFLFVAPALAQEAPRLGIHLHGNSGSTPMLGLSYAVQDHIKVRISGGYFREAWNQDVARADGATLPQDYHTNWYSGAVAVLYHLPKQWRLAPYAGLGAQYLYATENRADVLQQADRFDAGGLFGVNLRAVGRIGFDAEIGVGYRRGLDRNSGGLFSSRPETTLWGITNVGVGLHLRL